MSSSKRWEELFSSSQPEIMLVEPLSDLPITEALDALRERKVVVANLEYLTSRQKQRAADYLAGCACAIDGQTRWLGEHTLLCTPPGVKVALDHPP